MRMDKHEPTKHSATAGRRIAPALLLLGALLTLAACAGGTAATSPTPAAAPVAEAPKPAQRLSSTEINEQCWMKTETNRVADLDKRMKLVEKCIDEKTKAQQGM